MNGIDAIKAELRTTTSSIPFILSILSRRFRE